MDNLISCWSDGKKLPEKYVFPPGQRPGKCTVASSRDIPVIDLGKAEGDDHKIIVQQMLEAAQDFGFFQVINHGVPRKIMDDARGIFQEFFELSGEEKSKFYTNNYNDKCTLYTSTPEYEREQNHVWRDVLKFSCSPLKECIEYWPQKPSTYREVAEEYVVKVIELGSRILELICEGLGLESGYFENGLSQDPFMIVNYYPTCPDPSLTLGTSKHSDTSLITILLQNDVPGLQVLKDSEWLAIEPIPEAFVVNMGAVMQIVSNGRLRSVEHRAVTNSNKARTSAALVIIPREDCPLKPAEALVTVENPALYEALRYEDMFKVFRKFFREKPTYNVVDKLLAKA